MFSGKNSMNWKWEIDNNTFDLVNISQFKNAHCSTIFALFLAIGQFLLTIILYVSDCYTCVRLLAYNSWASEIEPSIPFSISRWIFSGCILLSIVLLIYEWIYGIKVYNTRNISLTYTNHVARALWSLKGYSYFCLYDQITPKSFFDYCGFFVYFTLKGCVKLLFADSPRQVINGLTIYSVVRNDRDKVVSSFKNLGKDGVKETWAIVFTIMGLSFIIWAIFIIKFFIALIMSLCVVTKINQEGYVLKQFVCVRINEKVRELSSKYHKESLKQLKEENSRLGLKPTLPVLPGNNGDDDDDDDDTFLYGNGNGVNRHNTITEKFSKFRRSLRKSGNDLLPLNKHAAPPPPLPALTTADFNPSLSQKGSLNNLNLHIPQENMSPIYNAGGNVAGFSSLNKKPSLPRNLTGNSIGMRQTPTHTGYFYSDPKPNFYNSKGNNSSSEFASSRDNLLGSIRSQTPPIQPIRAMPRPHPLEPSYTGSTYAGGPNVGDNFAGPTFTGGSNMCGNQIGTIYPYLNNSNSINSSTSATRSFSGTQAPYNERLLTGADVNFTDRTLVNSNIVPPYPTARRQINGEDYGAGMIASLTGGDESVIQDNTAESFRNQNPPYLQIGNTQHPNIVHNVTGASNSNYIQHNNTASGVDNPNSPPYPTDRDQGFSPGTTDSQSTSMDSDFNTPQLRAATTGPGAPYSTTKNLPMVSEQSTVASYLAEYSAGNANNYGKNCNNNSNLPYANIKSSAAVSTTGNPNTSLNVPNVNERHQGTVSPNSRLLLINNLYGGEADNGDTGVSPILPTYKDMGLEEYLGKKR